MNIEFTHEIEQLDLMLDVEVTFEMYHYSGDYDTPSSTGVTDVEIELYVGKLNVTELIKTKYPHHYEEIKDIAACEAADRI